MSIEGTLAYLIPTQNLCFQTSIARIFELLKLICVGTNTGEVIIYYYTSVEIIPKLLLIPDPRQKTGSVIDIIIKELFYEELTVIYIKSIVYK